MTFAPSLAQLSAALLHARASDPLESCGVIAGDRYWPLVNKATELDTFVMDMVGFVRINREHKVDAIVHSHVYRPAKPSEGDRAMCEKTGLPWLIVSWPTGKFCVLEPCGYRAPLVSRAWAWGSHDCFGLIRDGIRDELGIELPDFPRDWLWWEHGQNLIADQFEGAGFVRLAPETQPQHCDVLGMQIAAPVVNHLGLFLAPDKILHQMQGRLSVREVYGGMYQKTMVLHLRHRSQMGAAA
jgi:proteasome lid subunit RPN8/RPN11